MTICQRCANDKAKYRMNRLRVLIPGNFSLGLGKKTAFNVCEACAGPLTKSWVDRRHEVSIRELTPKELALSQSSTEADKRK